MVTGHLGAIQKDGDLIILLSAKLEYPKETAFLYT